MFRLTSIKRLVIAALASGGVILACRATQPQEAPPLAPRPEPVAPTAAPVPGAPDPIHPPPGPTFPIPDGGVPTAPAPTHSAPVSQLSEIHPVYLAETGRDGGVGGDAQRVDAAVRMDAGVSDAVSPDATPMDASPPDASVTIDAAPPSTRDAAVLGAHDGGVGFPPLPDASFPPDAARPMH